jgi:2-oxoisovalerate dehydrogenase E1 component
MYNKQVVCPLVLRTPMGGGRGYGPTHSQTLDKFLIGIDNVKTVALNCLTDPGEVYEQVHVETHPVIVIENKLDYGRKFSAPSLKQYRIEKASGSYPLVRVRPLRSIPTATIVTYGAPVSLIIDAIPGLIIDHDVVPEVLVLTQIHPLDAVAVRSIAESVDKTGVLVTVEEGSAFAGLGGEIIATVHQLANRPFVSRRIASLPVPIASSRQLETEILVSKQQIMDTFSELMQ